MRKCNQAVFQIKVKYCFSAKPCNRCREGMYGSALGSCNKPVPKEDHFKNSLQDANLSHSIKNNKASVPFVQSMQLHSRTTTDTNNRRTESNLVYLLVLDVPLLSCWTRGFNSFPPFNLFLLVLRRRPLGGAE